MERLVDRYLRDEALARVPLHTNQHDYQAGKSTEMALHQLVVRVEKALDLQVTALGLFLDIERAFNNACYDTLCDALVRHGSDYTIVRWIIAFPRGPRGSCDPQWNFSGAYDIQGLSAGGRVSPLL
jgi:hypothetical protein